MKHLKHARIAIATRATPDILLKHPDATLATYVGRQIKYMKHTSETLAATPDLLLKYLDETLATYVRDS